MNTKLIVSILVFVGGLLIATAAQASVTWDLVGTSSGHLDLVGVMITPDMDVNCPAGPPEDCPISGWLTIPEGSLGGPGTTIDLAVDPTSVTIVITDPPNDGNNFDLSGIVKDGYTCGSVVPAVFGCSFGGSAANYFMEPVEGAPRVVIGNGNVWISDQLQVAGETNVDNACSVSECNAEGVTTLTCGATQVEISCAAEPKTYAIGDEGPAGGIVFYVTTYGMHGMEAAPTDQSEGVAWGCPGTDIPGAWLPSIGFGKQNTIDIYNGCADRPIAASVAAEYGGPLPWITPGWYLPSASELGLMYERLHLQGLGDFADDGSYWSSTEHDAITAIHHKFYTGFLIFSWKGSHSRVRAIRDF